jgi:hypothetical protein
MKKFWRLVALTVFASLAIGASATAATGQQLTAWERFKTYAHGEKEIAVQEGKKLIAATARGDRGHACQGGHPAASQSTRADSMEQGRLPSPQPRRTLLMPDQTLQAYRDSLRQARRTVHLIHQSRRSHRVLGVNVNTP